MGGTLKQTRNHASLTKGELDELLQNEQQPRAFKWEEATKPPFARAFHCIGCFDGTMYLHPAYIYITYFDHTD